MAQNLRRKIKQENRIVIHDVNKKATERFREDMADLGNIRIADEVGQVVEESVSRCATHMIVLGFFDETVLSMI